MQIARNEALVPAKGANDVGLVCHSQNASPPDAGRAAASGVSAVCLFNFHIWLSGKIILLREKCCNRKKIMFPIRAASSRRNENAEI
jgi:hypothetical protein